MPRIRINAHDLEEDTNLDELEHLEEQAIQEKRIKPKDRTDRRKPISPAARARRTEERRRGKEYARIKRENDGNA